MWDVFTKKEALTIKCGSMKFKLKRILFFNFQSPRNGEDLSDAEGEHEANSHDEAAVRHRDSSPEDNQNGQVRLKVRILKY